MRLGFSRALPITLEPNPSDIAIDPEAVLDFPADYSPLSGSIKIEESDPHFSAQLGQGYYHAQRTDVEDAQQENVSMRFVVSELRDSQILFDFLRKVGKVVPFRMAVPGATNPTWIVKSWSRSHIHNRHWHYDVTVQSRRSP